MTLAEHFVSMGPMIHSSFDAIAQFLHRKTEQARMQTLGLVGPKLGPVVYSILAVAVLGLLVFLVAILTDTMMGWGYLTWIWQPMTQIEPRIEP